MTHTELFEAYKKAFDPAYNVLTGQILSLFPEPEEEELSDD